MASTYSTNLKIELIGTGEQAGTWGTTTNTNLGTALEQAVVGKADVTMSSTTITLTLTNANTAQDARAIYLNLTGSPGGAAVLEVPAIQKPYIVKNGSDQQVTIKVSGQTGVAIPTGKTALVYNNGTDVVTAVDFIPEIATTTVDTTNIEVTNIKAKDGTSAGSIADSTGVVTLASSVLTTTDINGGTIDGAVIGGASADAGSFTTLNTSGAVVFNDAGADVDFRVEGNTDANLLFVDASTDRVGIGTNTPASKLHIQANANAISVDDGLSVRNSNSGSSAGARIALGNDVGTAPGLQLASSTNTTFGANALTVYQNLSAPVTFWTNNTERMRLDSSGKFLVGTTSSPNQQAVIYRTSATTSNGALLLDGNGNYAGVQFASSGTLYGSLSVDTSTMYMTHGSALTFRTGSTANVGGTDRMVINSSGNVGIGTSTPTVAQLVIKGDGATSQIRAQAATNTNQGLSFIYNYSSQFGQINCDESGVNQLDLWYTALNHKFGRSTATANMTIDSSGNVLVGTTSFGSGSKGFGVNQDGVGYFTKSGGFALIVGRLADDGDLVIFEQAGTNEGSISVSGTTVSYNGGNLSRWAQMLTKPELFKGTVMSNLDEMNVYVKPTLYWTEEDELPVDEEGNPTVAVGDLKQETSVSDNEQFKQSQSL
jgi:hypothetical protein